MALNRENAQTRNRRQAIFLGKTEPRATRQEKHPLRDVLVEWPVVGVFNNQGAAHFFEPF
jgi:hypothetical protein